jgi:hypothetical protein
MMEVMAAEMEKPLTNGLPVKVFFLRGADGKMYLSMESFTKLTHRHVPIRLNEKMEVEEFRGYLQAARAALDAAEWR